MLVGFLELVAEYEEKKKLPPLATFEIEEAFLITGTTLA